MTAYVAHVDINNAYVSMARLFEPELCDKAVIILSNNDGAVVARSQEAKDLGIAMGTPWFQLAANADRWGLIARSSNYEHIGNMHERVMTILGRFTDRLGIYSVDEAFLEVHGTTDKLQQLGQHIKNEILRLTGLPVSVGIAKTKVLAKLSTNAAKHIPELHGVCVWDRADRATTEALISRLPAKEIWGIGERTAKRLEGMGIWTIKDLRDADEIMIRDKFSIVQMRIVLELRGVRCIPLEEPQEVKGQLIFSRAFAQPVTSRTGMEQVLGMYAQQAAAKLHRHQKQARLLTAWAMTSLHSTKQQHQPTVTVRLPGASADPVVLARAAKELLPQILAGVNYVRAGIMLTDLRKRGQQPFLEPFVSAHEEKAIGPLIEEIRHRHGPHILGLGVAGLRTAPEWQMRRNMLSPRYTTHWDELATAHA